MENFLTASDTRKIAEKSEAAYLADLKANDDKIKQEAERGKTKFWVQFSHEKFFDRMKEAYAARGFTIHNRQSFSFLIEC